MRLCFFILFPLLFSSVFGQETQTSTNPNPALVLKATPLKLVGLFHPGIELAIESANKKNPSWSTQLMASYIAKGYVDATNSERLRGYRLALEQKKYRNSSAPTGKYVALELDYFHLRFYQNFNYSYADPIERVLVNKQVLSINAKLGVQKIYGSIALDFYVGLGIRGRYITHAGMSDPTAQRINIKDDFDSTYLSKGRSWGIALPLNFRIGYAF